MQPVRQPSVPSATAFPPVPGKKDLEPLTAVRNTLYQYFQAVEKIEKLVDEIETIVPEEVKPLLMSWLLLHLFFKRSPQELLPPSIKSLELVYNPLFFDLHFHPCDLIERLINRLWNKEEFRIDLTPFMGAFEVQVMQEQFPRILYKVLLTPQSTFPCTPPVRRLIDSLIKNGPHCFNLDFTLPLIAMVRGGLYQEGLSGVEGLAAWLNALSAHLPPMQFLQILETLPLANHPDLCHLQLHRFDENLSFKAADAKVLLIYLKSIFEPKNLADCHLLHKLAHSLMDDSPAYVVYTLLQGRLKCAENAPLLQEALENCGDEEILLILNSLPPRPRKNPFVGDAGECFLQRIFSFGKEFVHNANWVRLVIDQIIPLSQAVRDGILDVEEQEVIAEWIHKIPPQINLYDLFEFLIHFPSFPYFYTQFSHRILPDLILEALYFHPHLELVPSHQSLDPCSTFDFPLAVSGVEDSYDKRLLGIYRSLPHPQLRTLLQKERDVFISWVAAGRLEGLWSDQSQIDYDLLSLRIIRSLVDEAINFSPQFCQSFKKIVKGVSRLLIQFQERTKSLQFLVQLAAIARVASSLFKEISQDISNVIILASTVPGGEEESTQFFESIPSIAAANRSLVHLFAGKVNRMALLTLSISNPCLLAAAKEFAVAFDILPPIPSLNQRLHFRQIRGCKF